MCLELEMRADFFSPDSELTTIYLGGGTPSQLSAGELGRLLEVMYRNYSIASEVEFTLEANPDDLSSSYLKEITTLGVNRLSIGIQSFLEEDLKAMNRSHSAVQAMACVEEARRAGIHNLSIDLIFGLENQSLDAWRQNLEQALALEVPHLSCYALTVEEKTVLAHQVRTGQVTLPEDPVYESQFLMADQLLVEAGYTHYELSNYCLPGYHSRHNASYWEQVPYLGVGPSAHSFDGGNRSWNLANNAHYIRMLKAGTLPLAETETLSLADQRNEYLMTGLRRQAGVDTRRMTTLGRPEWEADHADKLDSLRKEGLMEQYGTSYRLSPRGWLLSDRIIRDLFEA